MVMGKDDDLAGLDIDRLEMRDLRAQPALDHVVVEEDVLHAVEQRAAILRRNLRQDAPGCSELGVQEYTALEANEAQHVGEGIHGSAFTAEARGRPRPGWRPKPGSSRISQGQIKPQSKTSPGAPA
jgi:hypothetical protein